MIIISSILIEIKSYNTVFIRIKIAIILLTFILICENMQSTSEYRQSTSCVLKIGGFYDTYCCNGINFRSIFIVKILKVQIQ